MTNILEAFINIVKDIPLLVKPYSILTEQKINLPMVITASLDYGDRYDGVVYLASIKNEMNPDCKWSDSDYIKYDRMCQLFTIGYKEFLEISNPSPQNVFKACSWCMELTTQETTVIMKVLSRLSLGKWNGSDTLSLDDGIFISSIEGMYVTGDDDLLVNNVNIVIHIIIAYYNDLLLINTYRNTPFIRGLELKDILTIFYPEADMTTALDIYGDLLLENDMIQLMDTWIGIFLHEYFNIHSEVTPKKLIVEGLSILDIIEMITEKLDEVSTDEDIDFESEKDLDVNNMSRIYIIFAQHLRLNGDPKSQLFDIKKESWIDSGDKQQIYGMKLYHSNPIVLQHYAQVFSFLEMLNLPSKLLLG